MHGHGYHQTHGLKVTKPSLKWVKAFPLLIDLLSWAGDEDEAFSLLRILLGHTP